MTAAMQRLVIGKTRLPDFGGEWTTRRLGDLVDIDPENLPANTDPDHEFNYISLEQVEAGRLRGYTVEIFRTSPSRARRRLRRDDVLMSTVRPNLMGHLFFNFDNEKFANAVCSTGFAVLRCRRNLSVPGFLFAHLFGPVVNKQIERTLAGSNYPAISSQDVALIEIPCPSIREQTAIAAVLSDVDRLLESLDAVIAKKRAVKEAAMQQLLTGKTRLSGFKVDGSGTTNNEPAGDAHKVETTVGILRFDDGETIPHGWKIVRLGDVSNIKTGSRNNQDKVENGQYPFFVRSDVVERIDTYSHECEAIIIPGEGRIGSIFHYINGRFELHQRSYKVSGFTANMHGKFVYYAMIQFFGTHAMKHTVRATVDSLRLPTFKNFSFPVPQSRLEQRSIAAILSDMDAEIDALERRRDKARALKEGMMQQLLTGRMRLATAE